VQGNVTIGVGAFSYAGQLNFGVVGDPDAVPDLALFADGIADTLDQLGSLAGAEDGHGHTQLVTEIPAGQDVQP
jgi:diacylglycerol O-acyltransferase / wax synthase